VPEVVLLSLSDRPDQRPGTAVLGCADLLRSGGARVTLRAAGADAEVDAALRPLIQGDAELVIAAATDGQLRAVLRRLVRQYAPPPSQRPAGLPADRTVPDLPPVGVLPVVATSPPELVARLGLPVTPAAVARAVLGRNIRRFDLLRHDGGSITLHGALIGGVDSAGVARPWRGRVEVDDAVLTDGVDPIVACAVTNAGASEVDGLPLASATAADDGLVEVAVAVPVLHRRLLRASRPRYEVRRAQGRAVAVTPRPGPVPLLDDGVAGELTRKRSWWVEPALWAAYAT
jgi:hypothetical protein